MTNRFTVALEQFKGTVLETMSKRANQNSDKVLDDVEFGIFTKDMEAMGMSFESLGLEVQREEVTAKEEKKSLCNTYVDAFGKKGAEIANKADDDARLVIETASTAFKNNYGFEYIPNNVIALRPRFTDCKNANEYENKMIVWRGKMENAYKEYGSKTMADYVDGFQTSLELCANFLSDGQVKLAKNILESIKNNTADIKSVIADGDKTIIKVLDKQTKTLSSVVKNAEDKIISVTTDGFNATNEYIHEVAKATNNNITSESQKIRQNDNNNTADIENHTTNELHRMQWQGNLRPKMPKYPTKVETSEGTSLPTPPHIGDEDSDKKDNQVKSEGATGSTPAVTKEDKGGSVADRGAVDKTPAKNEDNGKTIDEDYYKNYKLKGDFKHLQKAYDNAPIEVKKQVVEALKYGDVTPEKIEHILNVETSADEIDKRADEDYYSTWELPKKYKDLQEEYDKAPIDIKKRVAKTIKQLRNVNIGIIKGILEGGPVPQGVII